jgi:hypothetical protein
MNGFISYRLVSGITILCPEKEPVNIVLRGTGELGIFSSDVKDIV